MKKKVIRRIKKNNEIISNLNKKVRLYFSQKQQKVCDELNACRYYSTTRHYAKSNGKHIYFTEQTTFPNKTDSPWEDMIDLGVFLEHQIIYNLQKEEIKC